MDHEGCPRRPVEAGERAQPERRPRGPLRGAHLGVGVADAGAHRLLPSASPSRRPAPSSTAPRRRFTCSSSASDSSRSVRCSRAEEDRVLLAYRASGEEGALPRLRQHPRGHRPGARRQDRWRALRRPRREGDAGPPLPRGEDRARALEGRVGRKYRAAPGLPRHQAPRRRRRLIRETGLDASAINQLLWDTYKPFQVWYPFAAIGVASLIGLILFSQASKRWKDLDV